MIFANSCNYCNRSLGTGAAESGRHIRNRTHLGFLVAGFLDHRGFPPRLLLGIDCGEARRNPQFMETLAQKPFADWLVVGGTGAESSPHIRSFTQETAGGESSGHLLTFDVEYRMQERRFAK